ncbi:MAPEG family protein [Sphingomonas sp.]|uniref:MAPEG family protein n=1 Tax=Sphingomonas sp. TaxID=28214 RepID=UPI0025F9CD93|nr:MAPEG family protein [Sphingomonas sp.]
MALAVLLTLVVLAWVFLQMPPGIGQTFAERMKIVARADLFVIIWLTAAIANVARLRFFSSDDIAGSSRSTGSQSVRDAGAILQNTLEQTVLAISVHFALAAEVHTLTPTAAGALAGLFSLGRLLFWIGYRHGAARRAFGFALTFYPNVGVLLFVVFSRALASF